MILLQMIEEFFPSLPKIELNARKRRSGWDPWGNEVEPAAGNNDDPDESGEKMNAKMAALAGGDETHL